MRVEVQAVAPAEVEAGVVAVLLTAGGLTETGRTLDSTLDGLLSRIAQDGAARSGLGRARAAEIASELENVESQALGPKEIQKQGMGALAAVAQGSDVEPRLIVLRYEPPEPAHADLVLGLVGKAITFDTGGISLKPSLKME